VKPSFLWLIVSVVVVGVGEGAWGFAVCSVFCIEYSCIWRLDECLPSSMLRAANHKLFVYLGHQFRTPDCFAGY
jgi:hypothetical protein